MFHSLKDLLPGAVRRGRHSRQVEAAFVVDAASELLLTILPSHRPGDARILSFRDGTLIIECRSGSVADFILGRAEDLIRALQKSVPDAALRRVQTRLVTDFRDRMF